MIPTSSSQRPLGVADPGLRSGGVPIRLDGLCKRFGSVTAVESLSLLIQAGEFVTLLGPSGSGKTTTLMMIAGFEMPSGGQIWLADRPISPLPPHKRNLGVVFQSYALFPHLTVYENVAFPLRMRHLPTEEITRRVTDALALVHLPGYERRLPHQLSGGQQQRVALARALVFNPGVVLMDEPLGALDKALREHMQLEIKQLQRAIGTTVVYVTHDQTEALTMSDRIVVMNHGRLEQVGAPQEIYERPATRFVAAFLGASNFLDGKLVGAESGRRALVAVQGLRVAASMSRPHATGPAVTLMIRPEKVVINPRGEEHENSFPGTVEEAVYAGDHVRYRVVLDATTGSTVVATHPVRGTLRQFTAGERVRVGWCAADTHMLPSDTHRANGT